MPPFYDRDKYVKGRRLFRQYRGTPTWRSYGDEAHRLMDYYIGTRADREARLITLRENRRLASELGVPLKDISSFTKDMIKAEKEERYNLFSQQETWRNTSPEGLSEAQTIRGLNRQARAKLNKRYKTRPDSLPPRPTSIKTRSTDYRGIVDFFGSGPGEDERHALDFMRQEQNIFTTGKYGVEGQQDVYRTRRERQLFLGHARESGYFYGDPRFAVETRLGIVGNRVNFVMDLETVAAGPGNRAYAMSFGRWDPTAKGFTKFNDVLVPLEFLFEEDVMAPMRSRTSIVNKYTTAESGKRSLANLKKEFSAVFRARQREMMIGDTQIERNLADVMTRYDALYTKTGPLRIDRVDPVINFINQLKTAGIDPGLYPLKDPAFIGVNVGRFDREALNEILEKAKSTIQSEIDHRVTNGYDVARVKTLEEHRKWLDDTSKWIRGDYVPGGKYNWSTKTWQKSVGLTGEGKEILEDIKLSEYSGRVRPGAIWTGVESFMQGKAWGNIIRAQTKPLLAGIAKTEGEGIHAAVARLAAANNEGALRLSKLYDISKKATPTLGEMLLVLGIKTPEELHGAWVDAPATARIVENLLKNPSFAGKTTQTVGEAVSLMSLSRNRLERAPRRTFAALATTALQMSGGEARLAQGRLIGLPVKSIAYGGGTRFTLGLKTATINASINPITSGSKLSKKLASLANRLTNPDDLRTVLQMESTGYLSTPEGIRSLVDVMTRQRGAPLKDILKGLESGYMSPGKRYEMIVGSLGNLGDTIGEKLVNMDPLQRALAVEDAAINGLTGRIATAINPIRAKNITDREAARALDKIEGGIAPLERLRKQISTTIRNELGVVPSNIETVGKIADYISAESYRKLLTGIVASGRSSTTTGLSALLSGTTTGSLHRQIKKVNYDFNQLVFHGDPLSGIKPNIASIIREAGIGFGLPEEELSKFDDVIKRWIWGGKDVIPGRGAQRQLPIRTKEAIDVLNQVLPPGVLRIDRAASRESASATLRLTTSQVFDAITNEMAAGAAGRQTTYRGLWSVSEALRGASDTTFESIVNKMDTDTLKDTVRSLRMYSSTTAADNVNMRMNISNYLDPTNVRQMLGVIAGETSQSFDVNKVLVDIERARELGVSTVLDLQQAASTMPSVESEIVRRLPMFGQIGETINRGYTALLNPEYGREFSTALSRSIGSGKAKMFKAFIGSEVGQDVFKFQMLQDANVQLIEEAADLRTVASRSRFFQGIIGEMFIPQSAAEIAKEGRRLKGVPGIGEWTTGTRRKKAIDIFRVGEDPTGALARFADAWGTERGIITEPVTGEITNKTLQNLRYQVLEMARRVGNVEAGEEAGLWTGVSGTPWGIEGPIDVIAHRAPTAAFIDAGGNLLDEGIVLRPTIGGEPFAFGRVGGGAWTPAATMTTAERELGFSPKARVGDLLSGTSERANERLAAAGHQGIYQLVSREHANTIIGDLLNNEMSELTEAANAAGRDALRTAAFTSGGDSAAAARIAGRAARAGADTTTRTLWDLAKKSPANWKVLAAGAAGLAAITMMRKARPLMPEDSATYGGGPYGAYPTGAMPIGMQNTYLAPPPTQGMRASISGVVGPDVDIASLQNLVGGMGFANINMNDNSQALTSRDIDRMMSSRI